MNPSAMIPPRAFFSGHTPRQAPGNSSLITPIDGNATETAIATRVRKAKEAARISSRLAHR